MNEATAIGIVVLAILWATICVILGYCTWVIINRRNRRR